MILCLDVGNSQIYMGLYDSHERLQLSFRKASRAGISSDEMGLFLRGVLRENDVNPDTIKKISICSVVPEIVHSLRNCFRKYFHVNPFILQPGAKTGLKIQYRNPIEVGADRIANAIAATELYPNKNIVIVDFGTAITFCAIAKSKSYLGGIITPGLRVSMESLVEKTAKLPRVEIKKPGVILGKSTVESIQSGLYFGNLKMIRGIIESLKLEVFPGEGVVVIGTGGFASLYEGENLFTKIEPHLVLRGLLRALKLNS